MAARSRIRLRTRETRAYVHAAAGHGVAKKRGRRQPQTEDFQVALDLPPSPPILDRELRAIEVLLGPELQDLLTGVVTDSPEK
ncbi:hypothetical protein ACVWXL_005868 [Bradyrhizobium sp. GM22.5]